jgi:hypothetical protein
LIVSSDSDFSAILGEEGLQLSDLKYSSRSNTFSNIKLTSTCEKPILDAVNALCLDRSRISKPQFPIFENETTTMRLLIMIALGCDVWPGGLLQVGPSKVAGFLKSITVDENAADDAHIDILRNWIARKGKISVDVIDAFVMSLLYEPANDRGHLQPGILYARRRAN